MEDNFRWGKKILSRSIFVNSPIWILYDNFQSAVWIYNYIIERWFESGDVLRPYVRPGTTGCATKFKNKYKPPTFLDFRQTTVRVNCYHTMLKLLNCPSDKHLSMGEFNLILASFELLKILKSIILNPTFWLVYVFYFTKEL